MAIKILLPATVIGALVFLSNPACAESSFEMPYIVTNRVVDLLNDVRYFTVDFTMNGEDRPFDNRIALLGGGDLNGMEKVVAGYPFRLPLNTLLRPGENLFVFKLTPSSLRGKPISDYIDSHGLMTLDKVRADVAIVADDEASLGREAQEWIKLTAPQEPHAAKINILQSAQFHPAAPGEIRPVELRLVLDTVKNGLNLEKIPEEKCYAEVSHSGIEGSLSLNGQKLADTMGFNGTSYTDKRPFIKPGNNTFSITVTKLDNAEPSPEAALSLKCSLAAYKEALGTKRYLGAWPDDELIVPVVDIAIKKNGAYSIRFNYKR